MINQLISGVGNLFNDLFRGLGTAPQAASAPPQRDSLLDLFAVRPDLGQKYGASYAPPEPAYTQADVPLDAMQVAITSPFTAPAPRPASVPSPVRNPRRDTPPSQFVSDGRAHAVASDHVAPKYTSPELEAGISRFREGQQMYRSSGGELEPDYWPQREPITDSNPGLMPDARPVPAEEMLRPIDMRPMTLSERVSAKTGPQFLSITQAAGHDAIPLDRAIQNPNIKPAVRDRYAALQQSLGRHLTVNSGYRDPKTNARAGGARGSQHLQGAALDINVAGWPIAERVKLIENASALGFTGFGIGRNIIHVDVGPRRAWGYVRPSGGGPVPSWAQDAISKHLRGGHKSVSKPSTQGIDPMTTAYSPQRIYDRMEGGYESSRKGPDGKNIVRTLADVAAGRSEYITLAGDPSEYGRTYRIPEITYLDSAGQKRTLTNVKGVVHDTGSAFRGKGATRFDIPVDRDLPSSLLNKQPFSKRRVRFISE